MNKEFICRHLLQDKNQNIGIVGLIYEDIEVGSINYCIKTLKDHKYLVITKVDLHPDYNCFGIFKMLVNELSAINKDTCDCKSLIFFTWRNWNKHKRPEWFLDALENYGVSILDFGMNDINESVILSMMVNNYEKDTNVD